MLGNLKPQAPDKILALMGEFRADPRQGKIDLGVGVYKDATGHTPIMRAVHAAEQRMLETETTKTYAGLSGEPEFQKAMGELILGDGLKSETTATLATVGGTGALRQALELARMANPDLRVFVSDPTWPNHVSIMNFMGLPVQTYRYFDAETRGVDFEGMKADLAAAKKGDMVLLHGCCHNPTGANLTLDQWAEIASILEKTGALPLIDLAYQGFGDGLEEDAAGTRLIASRIPEVLIAASCSKNFGIYRERTGCLLALCADAATRELAQGAMAFLNRQTYSFPPFHGAKIVSTVLTTPELRADWMAELEAVRSGMLRLREQLAGELRDLSGSDRFGFVAEHRGMFSRLGATPEQVKRIKEEFGIYMVGDSRINIAGLNDNTIPILARAIIEVGV
ncbi:amino acid aminotransferase [Paracoccus denitrificans]|jgi:aromatic-amino-acid transaminase|uniref:Aromatic-amino-acid aminotransferase n=2 Tax=Paracoccus denitrificans TaxID=266 RepID=TYRB_PARDE|nr:amino acid aminotransferase [Paracoccus denitrificans]P95468.1 RecName: Full=Aromatic-amino-acid aminotransferase; Short=ARAT; Short=AROAT [Paracoccus denitrificans]1AY4_A Chain A, AROMATIC AMINO ACID AMINOTRANSFERASE [Paracoccus denitrificans]1AY4_B Chain B, AROMATIC AMINO ACID AMINOTRANSFERASE [Paracoccus denitrificans]1AY5_A Chain A, AROMATIC AMINO ACID AMINOTRANSFERASE [Paracoccus denitrificans]1AY5_B Chain B, AROMATIC AMINO ACID AMINOTRANSFERASE [Paracoccus denitrificans]1AY8_A Chain 